MFFFFINSWAHNDINYQRFVHASVVNVTWPWDKRGNLRLCCCHLLRSNIRAAKKKKKTSNMFSAQMNGHWKLSKDRKCWEQAKWCLPVTTSAAGDNTSQKIPTALLEREKQNHFNCSSFKYVLNKRSRIVAFFHLLCTHYLEKFTFHGGYRRPINISRSAGEDSCLSQSKGLSILKPVT